MTDERREEELREANEVGGRKTGLEIIELTIVGTAPLICANSPPK